MELKYKIGRTILFGLAFVQLFINLMSLKVVDSGFGITVLIGLVSAGFYILVICARAQSVSFKEATAPITKKNQKRKPHKHYILPVAFMVLVSMCSFFWMLAY